MKICCIYLYFVNNKKTKTKNKKKTKKKDQKLPPMSEDGEPLNLKVKKLKKNKSL